MLFHGKATPRPIEEFSCYFMAISSIGRTPQSTIFPSLTVHDPITVPRQEKYQKHHQQLQSPL